MSKESAVFLIPLIALYDWRWHGIVVWRAWRNYIYFASALFLFLLLRWYVLGQYAFHPIVQYIENPLYSMSFFERLPTALSIVTMYVGKILWPWDLSADYSYNTIALTHSYLDTAVILGFFILASTLFFTIYKKIPKIVSFSAGIFLFSLLIISNIFLPIGTIAAERLLYVPSLGFVIALIYGLSLLQHPLVRKAAIMFAGIIICIFSYCTIVRNADWQTNESLFASALEESPNSVLVHTNLAALALKDKKWDIATDKLKKAELIYADYAPELNLLGVLAGHNADLALAERYFQRATQINPNHLDAYLNLAQLYCGRKQYDKCAESLKAVIDRNPAPAILVNYIVVRKEMGASLNDVRIEMNPYITRALQSGYDVSQVKQILGL
jgi:tetratricopeptide (TPR) repeat protein